MYIDIMSLNNKKYIVNNIIMLVHTYVSNQEKKQWVFLQTMSINAPLFFQNICQCVSKHYKSSIMIHQYTKCIIETNNKGE